jgi:hypothetical protein
VSAEPLPLTTSDTWAQVLDELEAGLAEAELALASGTIPSMSGSWVVPVVTGRMPEAHCVRAAALLARQHEVISTLAETSVRMRSELRLLSSLEPPSAASTPAFLDSTT